MKVAIFTGAMHCRRSADRQMVAQSDGYSVNRHTTWRSK